jgi:GNAT superfamily N-acetyltransferase
VKIEVATELTDEISGLVHSATRSVSSHRGGEALLVTIHGDRDTDELLRDAVSSGGLFVAREHHTVVGFALRRDGVLEAVYVKKHSRRQGIARALINTVISSSSEPLDAYALPGDRATKSLYESFGWKARLLTMRAG